VSRIRMPREQEYSTRQILHIAPVNYVLDSMVDARDPRGREARTLDVDFHTLTVEEKPVEDLMDCTAKCDLKLAGIVNSGYASALACLTKSELGNGSVCIDMGESMTSISLMFNNNLIFSGSVGMAGKHVTQDISKGLNVTLLVAERLKTLYGGVLSTEVDNFDVIHLNPLAEKSNPLMENASFEGLKDVKRSVSRSHLISIIRPRIEETLEIVRDRLESAGFSYLSNPQVVFTGGGCQIPGLLECAQKVFGYRVRIGRPLKLTGLPKEFSGPGFSTLAGLAHYATSSRQQTSELVMVQKMKKGSWVSRSTQWFTENW